MSAHGSLHVIEDRMQVWHCAGCGRESPGRLRVCDCPTSVVCRDCPSGLRESDWKAEPEKFPPPSDVQMVPENAQVCVVIFDRPLTPDEFGRFRLHMTSEWFSE